MTWLTKNHNDSATHWQRTGVSTSGDPTFAAPVAIKVRWEERHAVYTNALGEEAAADAVVFLGKDVAEGDYLFLGTSTVADPLNVAGSRKVQGFAKFPRLLNSDDYERKAFLASRSR